FEVEPYVSCEDAISTWPETATSIGVKLLEDGSIKIFAPYGLNDLFNMILRRNPKRITKEIFLKRVLDKQICKKWPEVKVVYD
ncbi:nucleotidyltransferase family protein, partial [Alkaliphilus peptidifermentans]